MNLYVSTRQYVTEFTKQHITWCTEVWKLLGSVRFDMLALFGRGTGVFVKWCKGGHLRPPLPKPPLINVPLSAENRISLKLPSILWYSACNNRFCFYWLIPRFRLWFRDHRNHRALLDTATTSWRSNQVRCERPCGVCEGMSRKTAT